jgi:hypothetical protein
MNQAIAESVQAMVRPGKMQDLYYIDEDEARKQAFPCIANTRYLQQFSNLSSGSSTFLIPPANGVQHVCIVLKYSAAQLGTMSTAGTVAGFGLGRGWGYSAISRVSVRYGGSSQFFFSGQQILARALRQMPNGSGRDALLQLGGNAVLSTTDYANDQIALVYVALPHQIPSSLGDTDHALPTDLLTSQIQITCELNPAAQFWSVNGSATVGNLPNAFDNAYFQVQQLQFDSQDSSLARRIDMNTHAYAMPLPSFDQQVVQIPLGAGAGANNTPSQLVASGFRAGEVRAIQAWLTRTGDTSGATKNFGAWYNPKSITMLYAGEVYARFEDGSSQLWNLVNGTSAPAANTVLLTWNGSTAYTTGSGALQQWCMLPFSQPHLQEATTNVLVGGKAVTNGIINLAVIPPTTGDDWVLNLVYVYNSTLLFSKGTCDYVF